MTRLPWQFPVALLLYAFVAAELARQEIRNRRRGSMRNHERRHR